MDETKAQKLVAYSRRKDVATIFLSGVCDIFEVAAIKAEFEKAIDDKAAKNIVLDCKQLSRLDTSTAQLLFALVKSSVSANKSFSAINIPSQVEKYLAAAGLVFA